MRIPIVFSSLKTLGFGQALDAPILVLFADSGLQWKILLPLLPSSSGRLVIVPGISAFRIKIKKTDFPPHQGKAGS
jgi:hypothetical protein